MSYREQEEDPLLFEAIKTAGEYLESLEIYDLRYLDKEKLLMFTAIIVGKFAEEKRGYFENKRKESAKKNEMLAL